MSQDLPHLEEPSGPMWSYTKWNMRRYQSRVHGPWKQTRSVHRWTMIRGLIVFGFAFGAIFMRDSWAWLPFQLVIGGMAGSSVTSMLLRMNAYRDGYVDGLKEARAWVGKTDEYEMAHLIDGRITSLILGSVPRKGE